MLQVFGVIEIGHRLIALAGILLFLQPTAHCLFGMALPTGHCPARAVQVAKQLGECSHVRHLRLLVVGIAPQ